MIIERKPKSALVEEVMNFKKEDKQEITEEVKEEGVKPSEELLNIKIEEKKCENCIECSDRKEVAEQVKKLKEEHIKHKITKKDDKYIIECFGKVKNVKESLHDDKPTIGDLVNFLREKADEFENNYDENTTIEKVSNTYFLGHPYYFLGIAGSDGGYINLDNPTDEDDYDESLEKKSLKETFAGEDIIDDLIDRAKMKIEEGEDVDEAVWQAIDEGLIYTKDIYDLCEHYGSIETSTMIESFYDDLYSDVYNGLEIKESLTEAVETLTSDEIQKKIENIKKELEKDEDRLSNYKKEHEETKDEKRKHILGNKIASTESEIKRKKELIKSKEEQFAKVKAEEEQKIRDEFEKKLKDKPVGKKGGNGKEIEPVEPTEEEIKAYDSLTDYLKDKVTIRIETSEEKEKTLRKMLPDLEENQYRVVSGTTSGGFPMKFGISMTLHADNIEQCPEEFRHYFKEGNDMTTVEEVYALLRTHWDDFKDSIVTHKVKEGMKDDLDAHIEQEEHEEITEAKSSISEKIKVAFINYLKKLGYDEQDFNEYVVIEEKPYDNGDGDTATHIQIRNDLVDFYEAEEGGLISKLDNIVNPGYFEPYDAYVWDAYIWDFEKESMKDKLAKAIYDRDIDEDLEDVEFKVEDEEQPVVDDIDDDVSNIDFSVEEVKNIVTDVVDEIGDEMKDKEPEDVAVEEIIDDKIADAVEEKKEEESEEVKEEPKEDESKEEIIVDTDDDESLEEATGYDHYGAKEMEPFKGPAYIQYDGGPRQIDVLTKARNHRWIWKNKAGIPDDEWYIFPSFEDALKVQKEVGGEIMSWNQYTGVKEEPKEDESKEEIIVDTDDEDISEEDAQFLENLNISNNFKNEFKQSTTEETPTIDNSLNEQVVIKDDLGVAEDLSDEDDLDDLVALIK